MVHELVLNTNFILLRTEYNLPRFQHSRTGCFVYQNRWKWRARERERGGGDPLSDLFGIKWVPEVVRSASAQQKNFYTILYPKDISSLTCIITQMKLDITNFTSMLDHYHSHHQLPVSPKLVIKLSTTFIMTAIIQISVVIRSWQ